MAETLKLSFWRSVLSLRSLRGRMALLLGVLLMPAGVLAIQAGLSAAQVRYAAEQTEVGLAVQRNMADVQAKVVRLREVAHAIAANPRLMSTGLRDCNQELGNIGRQFNEFASVLILDSKAAVRCSANAAAVGQIVVSANLLQTATQRGDVVVGFIPAPALSSGPIVGAVAPFPRNSPARDLFVGLSMRTTQLLLRASGPPSRPGGYAALVDGRGRILQVEGLASDDAELGRLRDTLPRAAMRTRVQPFHIGETWAAAIQLGEGDLYLIQGWRPPAMDLGEMLGAFWTLSGPLLMWLLAVAASWLAVEIYVARPLSTLETLARAYARGEDTAAPAGFEAAPQEISSLRRTLAAMAKTLRGREQRLAEALAEEHALLLEVNHRVKNNLQMVASILAIQARSAENEQQAWGLSRAQDRIQLLALAHARIYDSGELRDIALDDLAADIARTMVNARSDPSPSVRLDLQLAPTRVTTNHAVPLAFLIGESLSNVLDAVSGETEIVIAMALQKEADGFTAFTLSCPGAGEAKIVSPLARRMIDAFARQLDATIDYEPAAPIVIRFRWRPPEKPPEKAA